MKTHFRSKPSAMIGISFLAVSIGVLMASPSMVFVHAAEDKEITDEVLKIAASIKNGNHAAAKARAGALAAKIDDLGDAMDIFKPRKKKGIGVGKGGIVPDGIEFMLLRLARGEFGAAAIAKESAALEEMGYHIAAVADVAYAKPPTEFDGKQNPGIWFAWTSQVRHSATDLAKAAKAKKPADVKAAAVKINAACSGCHTEFR